MAFEEFGVDLASEEQAGAAERLYRCTDGVERSASEFHRFESRVRWTWLGYVILPEASA